MAKFEIGKTYYVESGPCVFEFTIVARTAKFITYTQRNDSTERRVGITSYDGHEYAMPFGKFSMAPQINADRYWGSVAA